MTPDLLSLVITLRNPQAASMAYDQGRALAGQFLAWVQNIDPILSESLHDPNNLPRPYTISNLNNLPHSKGGLVFLPANSEIWFRITSLLPKLSLFIVNRLLPQLPETMQIGDAVFSLKRFTWEVKDHPWAGWVKFDQLIENDLLGSASKRLRFEFASPTAFHSHGLHIPYILPELAINSWLRSWNAYAPVTFPGSLREVINESVAVSYYKMQTAPVRFGKATFVGGIGKCTFNIIDQDPYWRHVINVLSAFAFYSGTGVKTALGMGQTRRLGDSYYRGLRTR